jgi:hypothetical protein
MGPSSFIEPGYVFPGSPFAFPRRKQLARLVPRQRLRPTQLLYRSSLASRPSMVILIILIGSTGLSRTVLTLEMG